MIKLCSFSPYWIRKRDWSGRAEMLYTVPILTIPPPWQSHRESFCRFFISSSEGSVGVGVGGGERDLFILLRQRGEAAYFTSQWRVSKHNNQVHLGLGIKSDRRTKKLKRRAWCLLQQQVLPACRSACYVHSCVTGGFEALVWEQRVMGELCYSLLQPWACCLVPLCPSTLPVQYG